MDTLQKRNIGFLFSGRVISLVGSGIQGIALPLYILDLTGSGAIMGIFAMLSMLPALITAPLSGVIGDRFNRKKIMVWADVARGLVIFLMALLAIMGKISIPALFIGQILTATLDSLFNSSSDGIIPDLVSTEELPKVNALKGGTDSLSMIIGPVLGGIIYGAGGIKVVFLLNAVSFIVSGLCELLIHYNKNLSHTENLSAGVFVRDIREVLEFILGNKGLKQLFSFAMVLNFLIIPVFFVLMPFAFKKVIGFTSQQYGFLQTFFMVGLLIGNIGFGAFLSKARAEALMKGGMLLQTVMLALFAAFMFPWFTQYFGGPTWLYFAVLGAAIAGMGVFNPLVNIPVQTNLQKMVSSEMRSRFFSVLGLFSQLVVPVGSLVYGILLDRVEVHQILLAVTLLIAVSASAFVLVAAKDVYEPHLAVTGETAVEESV